MDFEFIERIVRLVDETEIGEVKIEDEGGAKLVVRKPSPDAPVFATQMAPQMMQGFPALAPGIAPPGDAADAPEVEDDSIDMVKAPMVGTFYRAPAPDAPSFVESGDSVKTSTVVCILEAMKVMNEIKSGVAGSIVEILVENGQPVEFGQALFKIKKA